MARKYLQVYMDESAVEDVTQHMAERGYKMITDYVRDLIKADMAKHGKSIDFGIQRGGDRYASKDEDE